MAAAYACLLGLVVINSTNKHIRMQEGTSLGGTGLATVALAEGVYFVRGNNVASCLLAALRTALEAHGNTTTPNTYSVTITHSVSPGSPTATVTITRATGSSSFALLWADALTTFDPGLIGFASVDSAFDATAKTSSLSPSALWVSNAMYKSLEPLPSYERDLARAHGKEINAVDRSGESRDRFWVQENIEQKRMHEEMIAADPLRTIGRFIRRHADGKRFEFHDGVIDTGSTLEPLDADTRVGTFVFDNEFYPRRGGAFSVRANGAPLYSFQGTLLLSTAALGEEAPAALLAGAVGVFDPDDAATVTLSGSDYSIVADQNGGTIVRLATSGSGVLPSQVADVTSGRDVMNFFDMIAGYPPFSDSIYFQRSSGIATSLASTFGSLTAKTAYLAVRLSAVRASDLANAHTADTIWAYMSGATPLWSLYAREESGLYHVVLANAGVRVDSSPLTLNAWAIVAVRHGGGFIDIKVGSAGAWATPVASGATASDTSGGLGYNSTTGKGFNGDIGIFVPYGVRHTDDEVDANIAYLENEFGI